MLLCHFERPIVYDAQWVLVTKKKIIDVLKKRKDINVPVIFDLLTAISSLDDDVVESGFFFW